MSCLHSIQELAQIFKIYRERREQNAWYSTSRYWDSLQYWNKPLAVIVSHTFMDDYCQEMWILEAGSFLLSSALFLYMGFPYCRAPTLCSALPFSIAFTAYCTARILVPPLHRSSLSPLGLLEASTCLPCSIDSPCLSSVAGLLVIPPWLTIPSQSLCKKG